jgi:hypothetical protein
MIDCLFYITCFGIGWGLGILVRQNLKKDEKDRY